MIKTEMIKTAYVTVVIVVQLLISPMIAAAQWTPELEPSRVRQPMETLRISIPEAVSVETLKTLALELDNIDVTALVTREGNFAVFTPVQPLAWGKHELRLVEYAADGSIFEKGFWTIEIKSRTGIHRANFSADIRLEASHLSDEKNLAEPKPEPVTGQGGVALQGEMSGEAWEVSGNMDLIYNSQRALTPNQQALDMSEYLVTGQHNATQLKLGHHSVAQTSLAMENFYRRGASVTQGFSAINSAVTGFILRTEEINGFKNGLGIGDANNRVYGITLENQPITSSPESLYLSSTYLSGESHSMGETVGGTQTTQQGETWSVVADSSLLKQQLRFRAEMATSTSDIITVDTTDQDFLGAKGDAVSFLSTYTPQSGGANSSFFWNTGFEYSKVDTLFNSIANPNLPNDKKLQRLFFNADWSGLSAQLSVAKETDNLNNDETRPEIETKQNQLLLNYSLTQVPRKGSFFDVIGLPALSLQWGNTVQIQTKKATVATATIFEKLDIENDIYRLGADFNQTSLSWGLSYSESQQKDKINSARSSTTTETDIHASYQLNQYFIFAPSATLNNTEFSDGDSKTDIYNIVAQIYLTDRINNQIYFNQAITSSDSLSNLQETETSTVSFQLNWNWILPKNNKPGFDVSLSGTYQDTQNKLIPNSDISAYQVFVKIAMSLPVRYTY